MPNARFLAALCLLLSVVWAGTIRAEETLPSAVGRISAASGAISLRPAGGEWGAATLNDPLIAGMAGRTAAPAPARPGHGARQNSPPRATGRGNAHPGATTPPIAGKQGPIRLHFVRP